MYDTVDTPTVEVADKYEAEAPNIYEIYPWEQCKVYSPVFYFLWVLCGIDR